MNADARNSRTPIRIMVVDDHPIVREGFGSMIGTEPDMRVVAEARSGDEAIVLFRQHRPDVTLMDLRMPGRNGVDTIDAIRREYPHSRFIVLTTYDGDEDIYRALEAGAQAYLLKDMLFDEILTAIRAVHAGQRRIPAAVGTRLAKCAGCGFRIEVRAHDDATGTCPRCGRGDL